MNSVAAKLKGVLRWLRMLYLGRTRRVRVGRGCQIGFRTEFEGHNSILEATTFSGRLGFGSYLGAHCRIDAAIGRFCSISDDVVTITGRHPTSEYVSTHPAFYSLNRQAGFTFAPSQLFEEHVLADPARQFKVVIGHDVLISFGVRILEGVTIGHGAILAACCLVRSHVEPYAVYAGVPAKKVGQRFDDETVRQLLEARWWDRGETWIRDHAHLFADVSALLAACRVEAPAEGELASQEVAKR